MTGFQGVGLLWDPTEKQALVQAGGREDSPWRGTSVDRSAEVFQGFQGPHKHQEFGGPTLYSYVYHPKHVYYCVNPSHSKPF